MDTWKDVEALADENGVIPESVYVEHASKFRTCPPQDPETARMEAEIWADYLSARKKGSEDSFRYEDLYRFEWYEGRRRRGFWGNMEDAIRRLDLGPAPRITIFSSGSGRDLLKVGLAAGVWESTAPDGVRGTHKEISADYFRLAKPEARFLVTEFEEHNLLGLTNIVKRLWDRGLLTEEMIAIRRWDFRESAPVATGTQDLAVFSLTGNYATLEEQPLILREIARCVKEGGHMVASTISDTFDFNRIGKPWNVVRIMLATPLAWPILLEFIPWQRRWGKMAGMMGEKGLWKNLPAKQWAEFVRPAGMVETRIYPGPSDLVPVEVLVAKKINHADSA